MTVRRFRPVGVQAHYVRRMARRAVRCAGCGARYRVDRMRFLAQKGGAWLYLARCVRCRAMAFIGVVVRDARPAVCDATAHELERFENRPPVGVDDVLTMRRVLEDFDGDFARLFDQGTGAGQ